MDMSFFGSSIGRQGHADDLPSSHSFDLNLRGGSSINGGIDNHRDRDVGLSLLSGLREGTTELSPQDNANLLLNNQQRQDYW